jgi:hypothetical protein
MRIIVSDEYHKELERLGVNPLSGEGCQMGTRLDTDVCPGTVALVESYLVHWEGEPIICTGCGAKVESAYGIPEEEDASQD